MNVEEIKATYSMRDILSRYGISVDRKGFCKCPFHQGDREASLKVYEKDFYCFGCGAKGDVIAFVMKMDDCDFKTAFYSLGGTYEKPSFASRRAVYQAKKAREQAQKARESILRQRAKNCALIDLNRIILTLTAPLSDEWCEAYNNLQRELYIHSEMNDIPFNWFDINLAR